MCRASVFRDAWHAGFITISLLKSHASAGGDYQLAVTASVCISHISMAEASVNALVQNKSSRKASVAAIHFSRLVCSLSYFLFLFARPTN